MVADHPGQEQPLERHALGRAHLASCCRGRHAHVRPCAPASCIMCAACGLAGWPRSTSHFFIHAISSAWRGVDPLGHLQDLGPVGPPGDQRRHHRRLRMVRDHVLQEAHVV
jgi:hypothetical protein